MSRDKNPSKAGRSITSEETTVVKSKSFQVHQIDIDKAKPNCPSSCAIALAIMESIPSARNIAVCLEGDGRIAWSEKDVRYQFNSIPIKVLKSTYAVDGGHSDQVKPFRFTLRNGLMFPRRRQGGRSQVGRKYSKSSLRTKKLSSKIGSRTLRRDRLLVALAAAKRGVL